MNEIVMALVGLVCGIVSSVATFLLTKRKYNTEVDSQQITNIKEAFDGYKRIMQETVEQQNKKIADLERENKTLREQLHELQMQVIGLLGGVKPKLAKDNQCCTDSSSSEVEDKDL